MLDYSEAATAVLPVSRWPTVRDFAKFVADKGLQKVFDLKLLEPRKDFEVIGAAQKEIEVNRAA